MGFPRQESRSVLPSLLQGIFPTQGTYTMLCRFQVYSKVIQVYIYIQLHIYVYIFFYIFFHDGLLQDIAHTSQCYTVGPCGLSIWYIIVCIIPNYTNEGLKDKLAGWDWICRFIDLKYSLLKFILSVIIFIKSHSLYILIRIKTVQAHDLKKKKVTVQKGI